MKIVRYRRIRDMHRAPSEWMESWQYYSKKYRASDLLNEGLTPGEISVAIQRAMDACNARGLEIDEHFVPVYTRFNGGIYKDFRLSKLGLLLTFLNAQPQNPNVAAFQIEVVKYYLSRRQ